MNAHTRITAEETTHLLTFARAKEIADSFVEARFKLKRDTNGGIIPRTRKLDIEDEVSVRYDADVRRVGEAGVIVYFDGRLELVAWDEVRAFTVRDGDVAVRYRLGRAGL